MQLPALVLIAALGCASPVLAQTPATTPPPEKPKEKKAAVTRISYWTTRPGKDAAAQAFWKQFAPVFEEMKKKGLVLEYQFLEPALHTGQDWTIAYLWVCRDMATYGRADEYFSQAVARMDGQKISVDFEAAFEGAKHRDELWRTVDLQ